MKGTDFKLKVWETLLKIPVVRLSTYGTIAKQIDGSNASKVVGTAIGDNPVAFLIPCHCVIQFNSFPDGYMLKTAHKSAIIGGEASNIKVNQEGDLINEAVATVPHK